LCNIGIVYHALGHISQTLSFYLYALKLFERTLPEDHPHISNVYYQLSVFHEEQQQHELALEYAQRTLKIREKKLRHGHKLVRKTKSMVERLQNILANESRE
jgi:tetratricopeptide (TPR) repeat protein